MAMATRRTKGESYWPMRIMSASVPHGAPRHRSSLLSRLARALRLPGRRLGAVGVVQRVRLVRARLDPLGKQRFVACFRRFFEGLRHLRAQGFEIVGVHRLLDFRK